MKLRSVLGEHRIKTRKPPSNQFLKVTPIHIRHNLQHSALQATNYLSLLHQAL